MIDPRLPLTDIHRHLDGNIRAQTILDLGRQFNLALPANDLESLRPHVQITHAEPDLVSFLQKLDWGVAVLGDLDACRRVAYENVEDAANAGLHYAELRFSPYYMAMKHQLPVAGVVEAVIDGIRSGCRDRDIDIRLIGIMSRTMDAAEYYVAGRRVPASASRGGGAGARVRGRVRRGRLRRRLRLLNNTSMIPVPRRPPRAGPRPTCRRNRRCRRYRSCR